jgi:hypothetical protein
MCQKTTNITFCTCESKPSAVHNKNSRRARKDKAVPELQSYRWLLHKITGVSEQTMDGLLIEPDDAFNGELTAESILKELNTRNCFDFSYEPNDGDSLGIVENGVGKFISFIFESGKWTIGSPNPFIHQVITFNSGSVRFEDESH